MEINRLYVFTLWAQDVPAAALYSVACLSRQGLQVSMKKLHTGQTSHFLVTICLTNI